MGVSDQQKLCKVTVHRSVARDQPKPWERSTVVLGKASAKTLTPTQAELSRWTATGAAAVDGMLPTRRRAHTTTATMDPFTTSSRNPMSRLTMRYESASPTTDTNELQASASAFTNVERSDSFLCVDTDTADPVRQTFDEDTKMLVPATPPIPSGLTVDMLPTVDFTPRLTSTNKSVLALEAKLAPTQTPTLTQTPTPFDIPRSPRESRIRISTPGKESAWSSLFGTDSDYMDELPTPLLSSSVGTPLEDHQVAQPEMDMEMATPPPKLTINATNIPSCSYEDLPLEDPQPEEEEEDDADDEGVSSFIEVDDDEEEQYHHESTDNVAALDAVDEDYDVCENFDAILGEPLPNRGSRWRFSINPKTSLVGARQKRGMSSPPRMVGMPPPPTLARHMSVTATYTPPHNARPKPIVHAPVGEPLFHGQMLHLAFKSSVGHTVQVSTHQRHSKSSVFSKLIECFAVTNEPFADAEDALRIIAHTTDGHIRGGDRISLARADGSVLRIQKLSKKLGFSPKIDLKAKFVVCGVPEGTVVTDTNKFYLQSVYDRTKTIGFLKDRRHPGAGCLVLYANRTTDDKSEPIQFFKRPTPPSFAMQHALQQGHNLPTSPTTMM